jgi:RimJ/RimL family protein N-acetyltransferase
MHLRLAGSKILLRIEKRNSDDDDLFQWLNMEEWNYYDEPDKPFKIISRKEFDEWINERKQLTEASSSISRIWQVDTVDGRHIGWINYYNLNEQTKQAFIGICLPDEKVWGKGYCTEAIMILIEYLFGKVELEELKIATWTGNERMILCALKAGFKEMTFMPHRREFSIRGERLERVELSISRTKWLDLANAK